MHEKGSYKPEDITDKPYQKLIEETDKILSRSLHKSNLSADLKTKLKDDSYVFSGIRSHAQFLEASKMLKDDAGNLKSFDSFKNDFNKTFKNYNQNYLEAEYSFATNSTLSAENWDSFDKTGRYNLQYRTAGDDKVRDSHRILDLITLPLDDPFWGYYYPPNGWRCRCNAIEVLGYMSEKSDPKKSMELGEKATTQLNKDGKNTLEIFRFNPGAQGKLFPPTHPYNKVQDADKVKSILRDKSMFETTEKYKNGGSVIKHRDAKTDSPDYKSVSESASYFAKKGGKAQILPKYDATVKNPDYARTYKDLAGTKYWGKCPDLKVDDKHYEVEGFKTDNPLKAFKNMITRGLKQSDRVILEDCGLTDRWMKHNVISRITKGQKIAEVWIKKGLNLRLLFKNTEAQ